MARRKELHLLDQMREGPITAEQKDWYYRQFPRLPGHIAASGRRATWPCRPSPGIIAEVAPEARLLTIVREPVERYRSGLNQWQEQTRRRSLRRDDRAGKREALMRGFYGRQVQRLIEAVGRDRRPRAPVRALRPRAGRRAGADARLPGRVALASPTSDC